MTRDVSTDIIILWRDSDDLYYRDTHVEFGHRFNTANFPEHREMTKDDYVIIFVDFG